MEAKAKERLVQVLASVIGDADLARENISDTPHERLGSVRLRGMAARVIELLEDGDKVGMLGGAAALAFGLGISRADLSLTDVYVPLQRTACTHVPEAFAPFAAMRVQSTRDLEPGTHKVNVEIVLCPYCAGLAIGSVQTKERVW